MKSVVPSQIKNRVLIVDDHPLLREALATLVGREPRYQVCGEAATGSEALQQTLQIQPDLILLDLVLKGVDGLRLLQELRVMSPRSKILIISQHDEASFGVRAWRAGADGFINKEAPPQAILQAMADALSGKRAFSDGVRSQVLGEKTGTGSATSGPEDETRLFSARELEIFRLIGQGLPTRDVAGRLFLSVKTVEAHRENIKRKLGVKSAAALAQRAATWWSKQL